MSLAELLPTVQALPYDDKVRLAHLLITELAREEGVPLGDVEPMYPVWSPYNAFEAAAALSKDLAGTGLEMQCDSNRVLRS